MIQFLFIPLHVIVFDSSKEVLPVLPGNSLKMRISTSFVTIKLSDPSVKVLKKIKNIPRGLKVKLR